MTFKQKWEKTDQQMQLPAALFERFLQKILPEQQATYQILSGGCANLNLRVETPNECFLLRIYLRDKEAAYLEQQLAKQLKPHVPLPEVYRIADLDEYRLALVQFMPGITLRELLLMPNPEQMEPLMRAAGQMLAKIQSFIYPTAGFFDANLKIIKPLPQEGYLAFAEESLQQETTLKILGAKTVAQIQSYLKQYASLFPDPHMHQLVHGDYDPANILIDKQQGHWKISAVLDWEFAFSGSPLCDVATMLRYAHEMPPLFESAFLEGLRTGGVALPAHWRITVHLLNLLSLLDCLVRSSPQIRPNQCADIQSLIGYIMQQLEKEAHE